MPPAVVERHLPAGEVDHAAAGRQMAVVEGGARELSHLKNLKKKKKKKKKKKYAGPLSIEILPESPEPLDDPRRVDPRVGEAHVLLALPGPPDGRSGAREQTETPVSRSTARRKASTSVKPWRAIAAVTLANR